MKSDTEQTMKLELLYKVGSECKLSLCLRAQSIRAFERTSVVASSNPTQANFQIKTQSKLPKEKLNQICKDQICYTASFN